MPPVIPLTPALAVTPARRRAGAATLAGVGIGVTLIWGSLTALNRFVLGFDAWPQAPQVAAQRLLVADAPRQLTSADRVAAARLLGGGAVVAGSELVPGALSGSAPAGSGAPSSVVGGSRAGSGSGLTAPGVSGGVQGPSSGRQSKTDPDGDGIPTSVEQQLGTDPRQADSDGDGTSDGTERSSGSNPLSAADGGEVPASGTGAPVAFGPGGSTPVEPKDPDAAVADPAADAGGTPAGAAPADPVADQPGLGTTPSDPAAPVDEPPATPDPAPAADPAPAPDPAPSPDPVASIDPATAPESQPDPVPAEPAPADPAPVPDTGGVAAPADEPVPAS